MVDHRKGALLPHSVEPDGRGRADGCDLLAWRGARTLQDRRGRGTELPQLRRHEGRSLIHHPEAAADERAGTDDAAQLVRQPTGAAAVSFPSLTPGLGSVR